MSNRFVSPEQQFLDNTGTPYAGGFLYFYASGTSTPLNTYNNQALTIANTNPVQLDSAGLAGSVFLSNLAYKVVLQDANINQICTMDPVYSSDYSAFAQFQPWLGNPNGFVAGVAGTQGALPGSSSIWDYQNNILYICTTTGSATTAVWTAVNTPSTASATPAPTGYLTLSPDATNPVLTTDAVSQTAIYYTPYTGNTVPVFNGTTYTVTNFTQLTLTLSSSQSLNTLYDVFVFNNMGVLTLVTGPSWQSSAAGSGARGTGADTTQLQRLNGLLVNAVQIAGTNGTTTYTIPANTATYLGSIYVDGTAGQISCYRSYGQSRKWGVWNAYNRLPVYLKAGDPTSSWTYSSTTIRAANGNSANSVTTFSGLAEDPYTLRSTGLIECDSTAASALIAVGLGYNSVVAYSGGTGATVNSNGSAGSQFVTMAGDYLAPPALGINTITALENGVTGRTTGFLGTELHMAVTAQWRA